MSGRKCSDYELDAERQRTAEMLSALQDRLRGLTALKHVIESRSNSLRMLTFFAPRTSRPLPAWMADVSRATATICTLSSPLATLEQRLGECATLDETGKQILQAIDESRELVSVLLRQADTMRREFASVSANIKEWLDTEAVEHSDGVISKSIDLIRKGHLAEAAAALQDVGQYIDKSKRLASERQAEAIRVAQQNAAEALFRNLDSLRRDVVCHVGRASEGLRQYFVASVRRFAEWSEDVDRAVQEWSHATHNDLSAFSELLKALCARGQELQRNLTSDFGDRAAQVRAASGNSLGEFIGTLEANMPLLSKWIAKDELERYSESAKEMEKRLRFDIFRGFEPEMRELTESLAARIEKSARQEQAHERRLYLLSALSEVCGDLGFELAQKPQFQDRGDRASPIRVVFDTGNRGEIEFVLTLESIEADSCISGAHCFDEFQKLSALLLQGFGVETKFRGDETLGPRRVRRDARDEPTGGRRSEGY